jgi:hypothetical protein
MNSTSYRVIVGCGFPNGLRNDLTMVDIGTLYASVVNRSSLTTDAAINQFWNAMNGPTIGPDLQAIVRDEASKLQKPSTAADEFISRTTIRTKAGAYGLCMDSDCNPWGYYKSNAGVITLPYKTTTGAVVPTNFVWGLFASDLLMYCTGSPCAKEENASSALSKLDDELFRSAVREGLRNY